MQFAITSVVNFIISDNNRPVGFTLPSVRDYALSVLFLSIHFDQKSPTKIFKCVEMLALQKAQPLCVECRPRFVVHSELHLRH